MSRLAITIALILVFPCFAGDLPRSQPEEQGVDSAGVLAFVEAADAQIDSFHGLVIVRHGSVIAEGWWSPYNAKSPHMLYSLSKSFTSTAAGIAIAEGKLSLHDPVLKYFPDDAPKSPSNNLKSMRLSDLLRMSTGHQTEPPRTPNEPWTKTFLSHTVPFKPGTHFLYNTSATYMVSAMIQKATGETVLDYLTPRLFEPLGIKSPSWEKSPQGISTGGYGLSVRTEDIAKFGQLYLQKGKWNGKQLVPAEWIEKATSLQTSNGSSPTSDWDQGYGYQFWRCRNNAYRGDGAFGQYCIVIPEADAVVAINSGVRDMQAVLNLVWDKLLPAMKKESLTPNTESNAQLQKKLRGLVLKTPAKASSPAPEHLGKIFVFPQNPSKLQSITLMREASDNAIAVVAKFDGKEETIKSAGDGWSKETATWNRPGNPPTATSMGWSDPNTLVMKFCYFETPFVTTVKLVFKGNEVHVESETNVGFGRRTATPIVGHAKE